MWQKKKNNTGGRLERPRPGSGVGEEHNATRNDGLPSPFPDARHPDTGAMGAIVTTVKPGRQRGDIGRAWARRVGTPLGARVPASREGWPRWPGISHLRGDSDLTFLGGWGDFIFDPWPFFAFSAGEGTPTPSLHRNRPCPAWLSPAFPPAFVAGSRQTRRAPKARESAHAAGPPRPRLPAPRSSGASAPRPGQ